MNLKNIIKKFFNIFLLAVIFCAFNNTLYVHAYPSNAMVRVGIMDKNYTTVEKTFVSVYGTDVCSIYNPKTKEEYLILPKGKYLDITKNSNNYVVSYISSETDEQVKFEISSDFNISCKNGVLGIKDLIRGGKPALYRGEFKVVSIPNKPNAFFLVNCLDVEYYLKGVVPSEMPVHFGLEALKAQAVAARVYSLTPRTKMSRAYDVVDSVASQVYNGFNCESDIANKAIDETHGIVALYDDNMIVAVFSSTAGGYTECYSETFSDPITGQFPSPEKPYLIAKPDLVAFPALDNEEEAYKFYSSRPLSYDCYSPFYRWTRKWTKDELQNVLKNNLVVQSKTGFVIPKLNSPDDFGELKDIRVVQRGVSGKIVFMEIETDNLIYTVSKELVIRRLFTKNGKALPSANVVFKFNNIDKMGKDLNNSEWGEITAYGGGFGHGCGLSQYGAMYMAKNCKMSFDAILKHYYNGICLGTKPFELYNNEVSQCFYAPHNKAVIVIPNRKNLRNIKVKINQEVFIFELNTNAVRSEIDISDYINPKELNTIVFSPLFENKINHSHYDKRKPVKIYIKF